MKALKLILGLGGGLWDVVLGVLVEMATAAMTGKLPRRWIRRLILKLARWLAARSDTRLDDAFVADLARKLEEGGA